jgi:hypothetical protein
VWEEAPLQQTIPSLGIGTQQVVPSRYHDWLSIAFHALMLCVHSMPPLQVLLSSCFSDPHDLDSGWLTSVETQVFHLTAGFLRLIAPTGAASVWLSSLSTDSRHCTMPGP